MAKGTKDLRQATMCLLDSTRAKLLEKRGIIESASIKKAEKCKRYVIPITNQFDCKAGCILTMGANCNGVCSEYLSPVQEWILISWQLECTILENNIQTMEKWIVDDDYDY